MVILLKPPKSMNPIRMALGLAQYRALKNFSGSGISFLSSRIGEISQWARHFPLRRMALRLSDLHSVINRYPIVPT